MKLSKYYFNVFPLTLLLKNIVSVFRTLMEDSFFAFFITVVIHIRWIHLLKLIKSKLDVDRIATIPKSLLRKVAETKMSLKNYLILVKKCNANRYCRNFNYPMALLQTSPKNQ